MEVKRERAISWSMAYMRERWLSPGRSKTESESLVSTHVGEGVGYSYLVERHRDGAV